MYKLYMQTAISGVLWLVHLPSRFAASQGVHWYTFDSKYELQKLAELDPSAKLLVRLKVDNPQTSSMFTVHSKSAT